LSVRVALFTNNYLPRVSGVAVAVDFLERSLRAAGHETLVLAPDYGTPFEEVAPRVHRVTSLALPSLNAAVALPALDSGRLRSALEAFRPDVLHSHHPFLLGAAAADAAAAMRLPLVYTFHTLYEFFAHYVKLDFEPVQRRVQQYVRGYLDRCDLVVAPTEPIRRYLVEDLGVTLPTAAVPTGLDPGRFGSLGPLRREQIRSALGFDRFQTVLVWAGRVAAEKNPALALETLDALVGRGRDAGLALLGDGPQRDELRAEAARRGLEDRLMICGFQSQDELPATLAAGDAFLFSSFADTQGIVLYEAWAAGLPIVAVDSLAARAVVEPEANGLLAAATPEAFADAVERLLADPGLGDRPFPWERFGPEPLAEAWGVLYAQAIERGRRTEPAVAGTFESLLEELKRLRGERLGAGGE
jgi:glycosyltransferase involved in cell wall biosynthesis